MTNRMLYYLSKMLGNQLCKGEYYDKLKRCVSIGVLNFDLLENENFHNKFNFRNANDNCILTDLLELHTIELPKFAKQKNLDTHDLLVDWALFLSNPEGGYIQVLQRQVPEIQEAMEVLEMLSHDKQASELYEQRQKALRDKRSSLHHAHQGRQEGLQQGRQEGECAAEKRLILNLFHSGMKLEIISKATNIPLSVIKKLISD